MTIHNVLVFVALGLSIMTEAASPASVTVPKSLREELESFEPSAAIYLDELDQYLISSDDTTEEKDPWLFLMNKKGEVAKSPVEILGVEKMTDIESLSRDNDGAIYILSSQGLNKKGNEKPERNLFVKASLDSESLEVEESVELRPLLLEALFATDDPTLEEMQGEYEDHLDVESHFIKDGDLYVGLKEPQVAPGRAAILNLGPVDEVFAGTIEPRLWRIVDLRTQTSETNLLSDISWKGDELWATSTSAEGAGYLWKITEKATTPFKDFTDSHPEGLAFDNEGSALLLFDQGTEGDGLFSLF